MSLSPRIATLLHEFTLRTGNLPDRGMMPVPFPVLGHYVEYDKSDPRLAAAPLRRVPLDQIYATQRTVERENVQRFMDDDSLGGPGLLVKTLNGYAIADGHHRCTAAYLQGKTDIEAHVYEDAPAMAAGNGGVAGLGVGPQGEPGVPRKRLYPEAKADVERLATSKEHNVDFWRINGDVYRAPRNAGKDSWGLPMGKRWECSLDHWNRYRQVYAWAVDVKTRLHEGVNAKDYTALVQRIEKDFGISFRDVSQDAIKTGIMWAKKIKDNTVDITTTKGKRFYVTLPEAELLRAAWLEIRRTIGRLSEDAHDTFAGADVFDVNDVAHIRDPKRPWERFSKYVGMEEEGEQIRSHARKNWQRDIILRDSRTGAMRFLRKRSTHGRG